MGSLVRFLKISLLIIVIIPFFWGIKDVQAAGPAALDSDVVIGEKAVQCPPEVSSTKALAASPSSLGCSWFYENGLLGKYYDSFEPMNDSHIRLIQVDDAVQMNPQMGSPYNDPAIEPDTFSVHWSGYIRVPVTGVYTFSTLSDDGVRVTVGCQRIINRWGLVSLEYTNSTRIYLESGWLYKFDMDYQEGPINSAVFLFWKRGNQQQSLVPPENFYIANDDYTSPQHVNPIKGSGTGLKGEYFAGAQGVASGQPPVYSVDGQDLVFDWGIGSPDSTLPVDDFSARWSGYLEAKYSDTYYLECAADDGVRVWIDDELVLDKWQPNSAEVFKLPPMEMEAGQFYKIKIEYNEVGGSASCALYWSSKYHARDINGFDREYIGQEREIIPVKYLYMNHQ